MIKYREVYDSNIKKTIKVYSHKKGELAINDGRLYICIEDGMPGTWELVKGKIPEIKDKQK